MAEYGSLVLWFLSVVLMTLASVPLFLERNSCKTCAAVLFPTVAYVFSAGALFSFSFSAVLIPALISGLVLLIGTIAGREGPEGKLFPQIWGVLIVFLLVILSYAPSYGGNPVALPGDDSLNLNRTFLLGLNSLGPSFTGSAFFGEWHVLALVLSLGTFLVLFLKFSANFQSVFVACICGFSLALALPTIGVVGSLTVTLIAPYLVCSRFHCPSRILFASFALSVAATCLAALCTTFLAISSGTCIALFLSCFLLFSSREETP